MPDDSVGQVTVSRCGPGRTQIVFSREPAKKLYSDHSADSFSQKFDVRNMAREIVEEAYFNSGLLCSKSLLFSAYHCQIAKTGGQIVDQIDPP